MNNGFMLLPSWVFGYARSLQPGAGTPHSQGVRIQVNPRLSPHDLAIVHIIRYAVDVVRLQIGGTCFCPWWGEPVPWLAFVSTYLGVRLDPIGHKRLVVIRPITVFL